MAQIDASLLDIETPHILLDQDRIQANIQLIQDIGNTRGVSVRPHIKTHKCLELARQQIDAGAVGITSSKVDEALVFINNGIRSVTVAYPLVVDSKLDRLIAAARTHDVDLRLIVDSPAGDRRNRSSSREAPETDQHLLEDRCGATPLWTYRKTIRAWSS